jgi:hypothetical protein
MLKCPSCQQELESRTCPECSKACPGDAKYCCYCGQIFPKDDAVRSSPAKKVKGDPFDLENRVLCADGLCIGVIDERGVCCECGRTPEQARAEEAPAEPAPAEKPAEPAEAEEADKSEESPAP